MLLYYKIKIKQKFFVKIINNKIATNFDFKINYFENEIYK